VSGGSRQLGGSSSHDLPRRHARLSAGQMAAALKPAELALAALVGLAEARLDKVLADLGERWRPRRTRRSRTRRSTAMSVPLCWNASGLPLGSNSQPRSATRPRCSSSPPARGCGPWAGRIRRCRRP
jgi:hypothetical protein